MLHKLVEYTDFHEISGEEGFISKRIRFLFQFSPQGDFLGLYDYGKHGEGFANVPHLQFAGDIPKRQFLVDTIDFLTLYPWDFEAFKKAVSKLLASLKKKANYLEIKLFSEKFLSLFAEKKYHKLREIGSKEEWIKVLKIDERDTKKQIDGFLKAGGVLDRVLNNEDVKLFDSLERLKTVTTCLLADLEHEPDIEEIRLFSGQVMTLLKEKKYLELREKELKKKWAELLKKGGRSKRSNIKSFFAPKGPVDRVFNNGAFKLIGKNQFCLRLLQQAAEVEPVLGLIATAMNDQLVLKKIHNDLSAAKPAVNSANNATFAVLDNDNLNILVKESSWHGWWKTKQKELSDNISSKYARCLISGEEIHPLLTHPKIKGLGGVGGNAETSLISFKEGRPSFQSYGFVQGENAAISVESAMKYAAAVNHLLNHQHYKLAGAEVIYWYSKNIQTDEDIINAAFSGFGEFEEDDDTEENFVPTGSSSAYRCQAVS